MDNTKKLCTPCKDIAIDGYSDEVEDMGQHLECSQAVRDVLPAGLFTYQGQETSENPVSCDICGTPTRSFHVVKINGAEETTETVTERVKHLNDRVRAEIDLPKHDKSVPCEIRVTDGVNAKFTDHVDAIVKQVKTYDEFTEANDPHGEHDFGVIVIDTVKIFWKIDYFSPGLDAGSENPADIDCTVRVLTILLASEY